MDMSSMMGGSGGAYDVTAYVTMPEGASGAKAGKAIEELCADLPCQVTASGSMDSMSTYLAGSGVSLKVYGDDMEDLQSSAKALAAALKTVEGTGEVSDGLEEATTGPPHLRGPQRRHGKGRHRGAGVYGRGPLP